MLRTNGGSHLFGMAPEFHPFRHPMTPDVSPITVPQFTALKAAGQKITMLTAYDYPTAQLVDAAGIEGILVGDTLSMVVQGQPTTLPVTLDEMIYHAEMVGRAVRHALVVVDMPFPSFHLGVYKAIESAARILKETRCQAVKLEGGVAQAEVIAGLVSAGIPVMAHCGLRPQSIHQLGGYRVQRDEEQLLADAQAAQQAGAFAIVLECIPGRVGQPHHRGREHPHHRHRRGSGLRRPDPRAARSARARLGSAAASCQGLCRSCRRDFAGRRPLSRRGSPGRLPRPRADVSLTHPSIAGRCRTETRMIHRPAGNSREFVPRLCQPCRNRRVLPNFRTDDTAVAPLNNAGTALCGTTWDRHSRAGLTPLLW